MTISVVPDPPADSHATPPRPSPQGEQEGTAQPTIAVTLCLTPGDHTPDPTDALRVLLTNLGAISGLTVVTPAELIDVHPASGNRLADPDTVRIDARSRSVYRRGEQIPLSRREFDLLLYLAEHPGQVFTRGQLLGAVWGDIFTGPRTVDVHIRRLRHKLDTHGPLITTVRGVGCRLATGAPIALVRTPATAPHRTGPTSVNIPAGRPPAHRGAA